MKYFMGSLTKKNTLYDIYKLTNLSTQIIVSESTDDLISACESISLQYLNGGQFY